MSMASSAAPGKSKPDMAYDEKYHPSPYLTDRYIMPLFPFLALILTQMLSTVCLQTQKAERYLIMIPVILIGTINVGDYDGYGFYYNLLEFTEYDETLLLKLSELEQRQDTSALTQLDKIVVLRKSEVDEDNALDALRLYGWHLSVPSNPRQVKSAVFLYLLFYCRSIYTTSKSHSPTPDLPLLSDEALDPARGIHSYTAD